MAGESRERRSGVLAIDALAVSYLTVTGLVALAGGLEGLLLAAAHALAISLILWVASRPLPTRPAPTFLRMMYPLIATPLLYQELAFLNRFFTTDFFDPLIIRLELVLFDVQMSQEAIGRLPWFWLSEYLNLGYLIYYFLIPGLAILALRASGAAGLHRFAVTVALAFLASYLWFILFPVMGPRYWFGPLEGPLTEGTFSSIVRAILEGGSAKGTAFPSSHVAATCAAWIAAGREDQKALWLTSVPVLALALGTVYGGYHYAIDALGGFFVCALIVAVAPFVAESAPPRNDPGSAIVGDRSAAAPIG